MGWVGFAEGIPYRPFNTRHTWNKIQFVIKAAGYTYPVDGENKLDENKSEM